MILLYQYLPVGFDLQIVNVLTTKYKSIFKLGCLVRMVVDSILPHAKSGPNDHRKDAPPFRYFLKYNNFRVPLCKYSQHVNCTSFLLMDFNYAGCHCPTPCSELGPVRKSNGFEPTMGQRTVDNGSEPCKSTKRPFIIQKCMKIFAKKLIN